MSCGKLNIVIAVIALVSRAEVPPLKLSVGTHTLADRNFSITLSHITRLYAYFSYNVFHEL